MTLPVHTNPLPIAGITRVLAAADSQGNTHEARITVRNEAGAVLTDWQLMPDPDGSFTRQRDYLYAGGRMIAQVDWGESSTRRYAAVDHLGSTRYLLPVYDDGSVGIGELLEYFPFGGFKEGDYGVNTTHLFTGHERDIGLTLSELDYMHARYYSPNLGRFLSVDPVGGTVGSSQSWNRYAYVENNPIGFVDPTGEYLIPLGEHTDEQIKEERKKLKEQLKDKSLPKEQRKQIKEQREILKLEGIGNERVGAMLEALDNVGEKGALTLSDFTLTTDPANDFSGVFSQAEINTILGFDAFHVGGSGSLAGNIFVRTDKGFYPQAGRVLGFHFFGATTLYHEGLHKYSGGMLHSAIYGDQKRVFSLFRGKVPAAFYTKWSSWMGGQHDYYKGIGQ